MTEENRLAWDDVFKSRGHMFPETHPDLPAFMQTVKADGGQTVLDLGSGTGRHVVYLAQQGFETYGLDISETGLAMTQTWLDELNLKAKLHQGDVYAPLPYADDFFDAVISVQVIHHARIETVQAAIAEIHRVLKPGGKVFVSVPSKRNQADSFQEIAPFTFVPLDGFEKGLPHYFFDEARFREAFAAFKDVTVTMDATAHYCLTARS